MSGRSNKRKRRAERRKNAATDESSSPTKLRGDSHHGKDKMKVPTGNEEECLIFQDVIKPYIRLKDNEEQSTPNEEEQDEDNDVSLAFFELANAPMVGYRVDEAEPKKKKKQKDSKETSSIVVQQDVTACGKHTGGIVWETAYFLLQYLLATQKKLGETLEVGAGCGLVGQVLAAEKRADVVIMTETKEVMNNLQANLDRNKELLLERIKAAPVLVHDLDWQQVERDAEKTPDLKPHSFDTILGTDVVFTPKLVEPLWHTLHYMSHPNTNIYLCLQERCAAAHKLLLEKAPEYHFQIQDITHEVTHIPSCQWGDSLECHLFHITRLE